MSTSRFSLRHHPLLRLALYYVALGAAASATWLALPERAEAFVRAALGPLLGGSAGGLLADALPAGDPLAVPQPALPALAPPYVAFMTLAAALAALALSIPVSWVYMFTRQRKGYAQGVVQSLVLIPVVVAVIAALVRNSIALAFSLAGIIAAVRFRTNFEDSKDAAFMFVVTAIGLACGVQLEVAAVLSVLFVAITLVFWFTDFARVPPALEGAMAERRLARAKAITNRTSQFVARLDHEIIETMAPAQLDALAARVARRRRELRADGSEDADGAGAPADEAPRYDGRLRITVTDPDAARPVVEGVMESQLKRWKQVRVDRNEGSTDLVYAVRLRKGRVLTDLKTVLERDGAPHVVRAEVGAWL